MEKETNPPTLEEIMKEVRAVRDELHSAVRKQQSRARDPRKQEVAKVLVANPKMKVIDVCREIDRLQERHPEQPKFRPVLSWGERLWVDAYKRHKSRVQVYIAKIRRTL